jgi:hypothetical protein
MSSKGGKADPHGSSWNRVDPHTLFCIYINYSDVAEHSQVSFFNLKEIDGSSWLQNFCFFLLDVIAAWKPVQIE